MDKSFSISVIKHIERLDQAVGRHMPFPPFENPFPRFTGMDFEEPLTTHELQTLVRTMAESVGLTGYTFLAYQVKMDGETCGRIEWPANEYGTAYIEFESKALDHYDTLIKILSHELAHQFLRHYGIVYPEELVNEKMTDVTSVLLGFGR